MSCDKLLLTVVILGQQRLILSLLAKRVSGIVLTVSTVSVVVKVHSF